MHESRTVCSILMQCNDNNVSLVGSMNAFRGDSHFRGKFAAVFFSISTANGVILLYLSCVFYSDMKEGEPQMDQWDFGY